MAPYYSDMVNRRTCVYRAFAADDQLLYVGISMSPDGRFAKHACYSPWWALADRIELTWFDGREAAKAEERYAIANEHPIYNQTGRSTGPRIVEVSRRVV